MMEQWLAEYYREHRAWMIAQLGPLYQAFGELVAAEAGEEAGAEVAPESVERFVTAYVKGFVDRQTTISLDDLDGLALLEGEERDEALAAMMEQWQEVRPVEQGQMESNRSNNALAWMAFAAAGLVSMSWATFGDTCPYCRSLNGKRVGINESFLLAGVAFEPAGAPSALVPSANIGHPPAHSGCDCMLVAGL
jgi:hypothetical protein